MNSNEDETLDLIDVELDLSDEVWLPIIGYEGKYELSNYGRVRNVKRGRGLKVQKSWNQIRCSLSRDNKYANFSVSSNMDKYFPEGHYFNPSDYTYLNTLSSCNSPMEQLDDLPGEYWKNIQGFDDVFYISNIGRIKSASRELNYPSRCGNPVTRMTKEKMLVLRPTRYGYIQTNLAHNGVNTMWFVHRLVAIAFIPNPYNFPHVNHIDGDKTNNNVENLEWCTNQENQIHAVRMGLNDHSKYESGKPKKPVVQIDIKTGQIVGRYKSIKEAANAVGQKTSSNIGGVCRGAYGRKTIGGYYWKFESEVM